MGVRVLRFAGGQGKAFLRHLEMVAPKKGSKKKANHRKSNRSACPDGWRAEGSEYLHREIVRLVLDSHEASHGRIVGWLDKRESDFLDARGRPAPLWRVRYHSGELVRDLHLCQAILLSCRFCQAGDEEDLEEHELLESLAQVAEDPLEEESGSNTRSKKRKSVHSSPSASGGTFAFFFAGNIKIASTAVQARQLLVLRRVPKRGLRASLKGKIRNSRAEANQCQILTCGK